MAKMLDKQAATAIMEQYLKGMSAHPNFRRHEDEVVIAGEPIERPYGWVFFYQSRRRLAGEWRYGLVGNGPIVIESEDGSLHCLGTADPLEVSLPAYEQKRQSGIPPSNVLPP